MPRVDVVVECPVPDSFRVQQVAGMFDVPLAEKVRQRFCAEVPGEDEAWQIGLIVGPSGSGKSTIARRVYGERLVAGGDWPSGRAVVDCIEGESIKGVTGLLTAVGFSSPPSWVKPYAVLSNGERFRCDLARALARGWQRADEDSGADGAAPVVAFDEFTSVVDRNVARFGSAAIAKGIRSGRLQCRFVAVTCHYDVVEWLEPDWVLDMASGTLARRRLRRPPIELEIVRCGRGAWRLFAPHHYLSGSLSRTARCYLALWEEVPVSFCATVSSIAARGRRRISRMVTLPDYQGIGVGMRVAECVAELEQSEGKRVGVTASHPAVIGHCKRSSLWRAVGVKKCGGTPTAWAPRYRSSAGRAVVSFEYVGRLGA